MVWAESIDAGRGGVKQPILGGGGGKAQVSRFFRKKGSVFLTEREKICHFRWEKKTIFHDGVFAIFLEGVDFFWQNAKKN
jgi:hypothetical protein